MVSSDPKAAFVSKSLRDVSIDLPYRERFARAGPNPPIFLPAQRILLLIPHFSREFGAGEAPGSPAPREQQRRGLFFCA